MSAFDRLISWLYLADFERSNYHGFFERQSKEHDVNNRQAIFKYMDDIDSKSSALLAHVSMIIAAVSVMLAAFDQSFFKYLLLLELAIYIVVAIGLLRCVSILRPRSFEEGDYLEIILQEAASRLVVYERSRKIAIVATFIFLLSVLSKFWIGF